nr:hypothetical protein [Streptomyces sp. MH191]
MVNRGELQPGFIKCCFQTCGIPNPLTHQTINTLIAELERGLAIRHVHGFYFVSGDLLSEVHDGRNPTNVAYEIENIDVGLSFPQTKSATELLNEDAPTVSYPSEAQNVDIRYIHTFVENINSSDDRNVSVAEFHQPKLALTPAKASVDSLCAFPLRHLIEHGSNALRMFNRATEDNRSRLTCYRPGLHQFVADGLVSLR